MSGAPLKAPTKNLKKKKIDAGVMAGTVGAAALIGGIIWTIKKGKQKKKKKGV